MSLRFTVYGLRFFTVHRKLSTVHPKNTPFTVHDDNG